MGENGAGGRRPRKKRDLARERERRRERERLRKEETWERIFAKQRERNESEKQSLRAIVEAHQRNTPGETMLALAWTIYDLRNNFEQLKSAIDSAVAGKGRIGFWSWGPHKEEHVRRLTSGASP
jgi:hypothetical protein